MLLLSRTRTHGETLSQQEGEQEAIKPGKRVFSIEDEGSIENPPATLEQDTKPVVTEPMDNTSRPHDIPKTVQTMASPRLPNLRLY